MLSAEEGNAPLGEGATYIISMGWGGGDTRDTGWDTAGVPGKPSFATLVVTVRLE